MNNQKGFVLPIMMMAAILIVAVGFFVYKQNKNILPLQKIMTTSEEETYSFNEFVSADENMDYELVKLSDGTYELNIDGFQTMTRIKAHAEGAGQDSAKLVFDSYNKDNVGGTLKKGETLFTYTFGTSINELIILKWQALQPIDSKNLSGAVFVKNTKN